LGVRKVYFSADADKQIASYLGFVGAALIFTALGWSLVKLFAFAFEKRPARGLIDGVTAGLIAGIVGGYFGFGWGDSVDPSYIRMLLATVFSVAVGGVVGMGCDLVHPEHDINWKQWGPGILAITLGFLILVGVGIFVGVPTMEGNGISFSDLLLLFECYAVVFALMHALQFDWAWRKTLSRLLLVLAVIALNRVITLFIPCHDDPDNSLWTRHYYVESNGSPGEDCARMGEMVAFYALGSILLYAAFYLNHPLNRWIKAKVCKLWPPNGGTDGDAI
jgi:hypothetical protein